MVSSKITLMGEEDYPSPAHFKFAAFMDKAALTYVTGLKGKEDPSLPAGHAVIKFFTRQEVEDFAEFLNKLKPKTKVIKRSGVKIRAKKQSVLWQLRKDILKTAEITVRDDKISGYCLDFWYPNSNDVNDMRTRINWIMRGFK